MQLIEIGCVAFKAMFLKHKIKAFCFKKIIEEIKKEVIISYKTITSFLIYILCKAAKTGMPSFSFLSLNKAST